MIFKEEPMSSNERIDHSAIRLRQAAFHDADFLLALRNDEAVRTASFSQDPIARENHLRWLREKLASDSSLMLIAATDDVPFAQVRIDREGVEDAEISIAITADFRGKGYGRELLKQSVAAAFLRYPRLERIHALIKPENAASCRSFEAAGFVFEKHEERKGQKCLSFVLNRR